MIIEKIEFERSRKYPFKDLDVGYGFKVEHGDEPPEAVRRRLSAAAYSFRKRHAEHQRHSTKIVGEFVVIKRTI